MLRLLCPCSKLSSYGIGKRRMRKMTCAIEDVYRALSLLSSHIDDIQAEVWKNSKKVIRRDTRVIFYDCTNYYFEIEDNDPYGIDQRHPPVGPRAYAAGANPRNTVPTPLCRWDF